MIRIRGIVRLVWSDAAATAADTVAVVSDCLGIRKILTLLCGVLTNSMAGGAFDLILVERTIECTVS